MEETTPNADAREMSQDEADFGLMNTVLLHCLTLLNEAHSMEPGDDPDETPIQKVRRHIVETMRDTEAYLTRPDDEGRGTKLSHTCAVHIYPPCVSRPLCYDRYNKKPPHPNACTNGCYGDVSKLSICLNCG